MLSRKSICIKAWLSLAILSLNAMYFNTTASHSDRISASAFYSTWNPMQSRAALTLKGRLEWFFEQEGVGAVPYLEVARRLVNLGGKGGG